MNAGDMEKFNAEFPVFDVQYEDVRDGYSVEIKGLIDVINSDIGRTYIGCFDNNTSVEPHLCFLDRENRKKLKKFLKKKSIVEISDKSPVLKSVFYLSHLAVCSEILSGVKIPVSMLRAENHENILDFLLLKYKDSSANVQKLSAFSGRLHSGDALRTMQILKFLGLIDIDPSSINQLSLGVGSGQKDLRSVHLKPKIQISAADVLSFSAEPLGYKKLILIDGDPQRKELFEKYNSDEEISVNAINATIDVAVESLIRDEEDKRFEKVNRVVGLRIDHRMIPDVNHFFKLLSRVMADQIDLIITIGSGFDIEDYEGRVLVIKKLFDYLSARGLNPLLLKLHGEGSLTDQRRSHAFGLGNITTYQILFCKVKKSRLFSN